MTKHPPGPMPIGRDFVVAAVHLIKREDRMPTTNILLEVATSLYIQQGARVSAAQIAEAVGCSRSLVLKKYPTKQALMLGALEYQRAKVQPLWQDVDAKSSPEHVLLLCITTYQTYPEWYQLLGRLVLDVDQDELQEWINKRPIFEPIKKVITRLAYDAPDAGWSAESLLLTTNLLCIGLSLYGPVFSKWYGIDQTNQHRIEGHVLAQMQRIVRSLQS